MGVCCRPFQFVTNAVCDGGINAVIIVVKSDFKLCLCACRCLDKEQLGSCAEGGQPAQSDLHCSSAGVLGGRHVPTTLR